MKPAIETRDMLLKLEDLLVFNANLIRGMSKFLDEQWQQPQTPVEVKFVTELDQTAQNLLNICAMLNECTKSIFSGDGDVRRLS